MEYHKTKDILHVMRLLGHKNIKNTLIYTHLVGFEEDDQYIVKVASSLDEFTKLLEQDDGFGGLEHASVFVDRLADEPFDFAGRRPIRHPYTHFESDGPVGQGPVCDVLLE